MEEISRILRLPFPWENPFFDTLNGFSFPAGVYDRGQRSATEPVRLGLPPAKRPRIAPRSAQDVGRERVLRAWAEVFRACPESPAGRQVAGAEGEEECLRVVGDILALKATGTLQRRLSSITAFQKWAGKLEIPIDEKLAYEYVSNLEKEMAPSTKAQGFMEALHFVHGMMDIEQVVSKRIKGV
eukprot:1721667-Amphidinium_carterae.1